MNRKIINMIFNYRFLTEGAAGEGGEGGREFHFCPSLPVKVTPAALFSDGGVGGVGGAEERENVEVHQSAGEEGALKRHSVTQSTPREVFRHRSRWHKLPRRAAPCQI